MSPVEVAGQKQTSLTHSARWGKTGWAYHGLATEKVLPTDGKPGFVNKTERISLAYPHIYTSVDLSIYIDSVRGICRVLDFFRIVC